MSNKILDVIGSEGLDDMTLLSQVTIEKIRDNLIKRLQAGIIYTKIGDVLVSVNPHKKIDIYGADIATAYSTRSALELPPHIFSVAQSTIDSLKSTGISQCVAVTGESGGGKTIAARHIMDYICDVCSSNNSPTSNSTAVKETVQRVCRIVTESTPLLEAFGNARTKHNDNSSRFGRLTQIRFDDSYPASSILGGKITYYLLEKTRVVMRAKGERSFHIFYQLCKGAPDDWRRDLEIGSATSYAYLYPGEEIPEIDDNLGFQATQKAMEAIGFSLEERKGVARILSAILNLGNIKFKDDPADFHAIIVDKKPLAISAKLLGTNPDWLEQVIVMRSMETNHGFAALTRGTKYMIPLNSAKASAARDSLAKALYASLFDWLVDRINNAMPFGPVKEGAKIQTISILDIFGFEIFEENHFENLCINYINEMMQQLFIEHTLKKSQEEYMSEGIPWKPIPFFDNKSVCELIDSKNPPGIMALLDDCCKTVHAQKEPGEADKAFVQTLQGSQLSKSQYLRWRGNQCCVVHYAGAVCYEPKGMTASNTDTLLISHLEMLCASSEQAIKNLFKSDSIAVREAEGKIPPTIGQRFRESALQMIQFLSSNTLHHVCCLRPSRTSKLAGVFESEAVSEQVRCLNLVENVRVKRAGCANSFTFERFVERYYLASPKTSNSGRPTWKELGLQESVEAILQVRGLVKGQHYEIGKTKVFLRAPEVILDISKACNGYSHSLARRIVQALRACRESRQQSALFIQRSYRSWRNQFPSMRLRAEIESALMGRKERKRLSMTSMRQFMGDYLNSMSVPAIRTTLMSSSASNERIEFSCRCSDIALARGGVLRKDLRLRSRLVILTNKSLLLLKFFKDKLFKISEHISLSEICWLSMSPFADGFVVISLGGPIGSDDGRSIGILCDLSTEFVARIRSLCSKTQQIQLGFSSKLEFKLKKGGPKVKLSFTKGNSDDLSSFAKGIITVGPGLPSTAQPSSVIPKLAIPINRSSSNNKITPKQTPKQQQPQPQPQQTTTTTITTTTHSQQPTNQAPAPPKPMAIAVEVVFPYQAQQPDEVSVVKGQNDVLVYSDVKIPMWSLVLASGKLGLVPSRCLLNKS